MFLFQFLCIYHHKFNIFLSFKSQPKWFYNFVKAYHHLYAKALINTLFFSLNVLTYSLTLGNIKTNGLITSSKHPNQIPRIILCYNFEATILSTSTSQIFISFFHHKILILLALCYQISTFLYFQKIKKICCHYFLAN